jgi:hypothetical protein
MDLSAAQPTPTLLVDTVLQDARDLIMDGTNDLSLVADGSSGVIAYTDLLGSYAPGHLFSPAAGFSEVTSLTGYTNPDPMMPSIWFSAWPDGGVGYSVYRADLDVSGSEPVVDSFTELASGLGVVVDLALDEEGNNLLIAETHQILKMDLSNNQTTQVVTGMNITGVDVIPGSVVPEPVSLLLFLLFFPFFRRR